jgi:hypothetical protein
VRRPRAYPRRALLEGRVVIAALVLLALAEMLIVPLIVRWPAKAKP